MGISSGVGSSLTSRVIITLAVIVVLQLLQCYVEFLRSISLIKQHRLQFLVVHCFSFLDIQQIAIHRLHIKADHSLVLVQAEFLDDIFP